MRELRGKVAVVTGAASGIGRAMAGRFARVLTHPKTKKAVENRTREIVEGRSPRFDPGSL